MLKDAANGAELEDIPEEIARVAKILRGWLKEDFDTAIDTMLAGRTGSALLITTTIAANLIEKLADATGHDVMYVLRMALKDARQGWGVAE